MANETITISMRLPKGLHDDLEKYVKLGNYASKTEALREAIRAKLYESTAAMRGAIKTKKKITPMSAWRKKEWDAALKKAGGDSKKAAQILKQKEKKAISGLKL